MIAIPICGAAVTLSGRVVEDHSGSGVASADIRVFRSGTRGVTAELESDGDGRFHAESLPEGEYRLEITKANHVASRVAVSLTGAAPVEIVARLVRCGSFAGRVLNASGEPVRGAIVYAMRAGGALRQERAQGRFAYVGDDGGYRIYNLPPDQYVLAAAYGATAMTLGRTGESASAPGLGSGMQIYPSNARPQPFTISGGESFQNVDFSIASTNVFSVAGSVEGGAIGRMQGSFWLTLVIPEQTSISVAAATTKEDGTFKFEGVPSGAYDLLVSGPSRARGQFGAMLDGDGVRFGRTRINVGSQNIDGVQVSMSPGRTAIFELKTPPVGCASTGDLSLTGLEDWSAQVERKSQIKAAAPLSLTGLAPSLYRVSVSGLGETCHVAEGTMLDLTSARGESPVVLTASAAGAIHGSVQSANGQAGVSVVLTAMNDPEQPVQAVKVGSDTKFAFGPLRPGRYRVAAKTTSKWSGDTEGLIVDVPAGPAVNVALTVPVPTSR